MRDGAVWWTGNPRAISFDTVSRCTGRGAVRWPGAFAASCFASFRASGTLARGGAAPASGRSVSWTQNPMDEELRQAIVDNVMRIWVSPDVDARKAAGALTDSFILDRAQVVMNVGHAPLVRLNDEVRIQFHIHVERTGPPNPDTGETPALLDLRFDLPPDEDVNAGWIFIINLYGVWQPYFDFRYNSARAFEHATAAREFLASAKADLLAERFRPFVESLWSEAELMAKSLMLLLPDEQVLSQRNHRGRQKKLEQYVGGIGRHQSFLDLLTQLQDLRNPARYLESGLTVDTPRALELMTLAEKVQTELETLLPRRTLGRELPSS